MPQYYKDNISLNFLLKATGVFLLLLCSFNSFSLGQLGHQVVCQLSFDHLSNSEQDKITNLLTSMPPAHQKLLNKYARSKQGSPINFAKSCVWADAIKKLDRYKKHDSSHYLNVSRNTPQIANAVCKENCIGQAIITNQQQLALETQPWKKLQALMFLGHWLGDIHQPLHVSYANDWGGNKVKISKKSNTRCKSLHWYWDDCVLAKQHKSFDQWIPFLNKQWDKHPVKTWQPNNVWQWANESYQIATASTFKYCQKSQGVCKPYKNNKITLPPNYQTQYAPVINQRMVLAAKRLTDILQNTL
jgi:hypothetical protein